MHTHTHTYRKLSELYLVQCMVCHHLLVCMCVQHTYGHLYMQGTSQKDSNPPNSGCLWGKLCLEFRGEKKPYFVPYTLLLSIKKQRGK